MCEILPQIFIYTKDNNYQRGTVKGEKQNTIVAKVEKEQFITAYPTRLFVRLLYEAIVINVPKPTPVAETACSMAVFHIFNAGWINEVKKDTKL